MQTEIQNLIDNPEAIHETLNTAQLDRLIRKVTTISALEKQNVAYHALMEYASAWCMDSVITLLCQQWYAYRNELTQWPPEWKYWDHGQKGVLQYEREKRKAAK